MADHYNDRTQGMRNVSPNKVEIMCEIEDGPIYTDQATLRAVLATLKNGNDVRRISPFDLLPDEMLMKIIRVTINGHGQGGAGSHVF